MIVYWLNSFEIKIILLIQLTPPEKSLLFFSVLSLALNSTHVKLIYSKHPMNNNRPCNLDDLAFDVVNRLDSFLKKRLKR